MSNCFYDVRNRPREGFYYDGNHRCLFCGNEHPLNYIEYPRVVHLNTPATDGKPTSSRIVVYFNEKKPKAYVAPRPDAPPPSAAPSEVGDAPPGYINVVVGLTDELASVLARITGEESEELLGAVGGAAD